MQFRAGAAILSLALFASGAIAALSPNQVVVNIQILTSTSSDINNTLAVLTTSTSFANVGAISQNVVSKFGTITSGLGQDVTAMKSTPPFNDVDAAPIVVALKDFVNVHQLLLQTVIGKQSIFAQFGLTAPIAAALRSLEAAIDSFAFAMIAMIPTRQGDVQGDKSALDGSVDRSISVYTKICIPSPFYPSVLPVCV